MFIYTIDVKIKVGANSSFAAINELDSMLEKDGYFYNITGCKRQEKEKKNVSGRKV